jgi:hypothetical protein
VSAKRSSDQAEILAEVIAALKNLPPDDQQKLLETVKTFYGLGGSAHSEVLPRSLPTMAGSRPPGGGYSEARDTSPKEFLLQKQPRTDVERVACLAFYLTHYRDTPHFKTIDISKLNTEAAQSKMSNAAVAVDNATKLGYLAPAIRGTKQISAPGEVFVQALPDREVAKSAMASVKPRKKGRKAHMRPKTTKRSGR